MHDLFRQETQTNVLIIKEGVEKLTDNPDKVEIIEKLARAAHSIKGAAKIVQVEAAVNVASVIEECFGLIQRGTVSLKSIDLNVLYKSANMLELIADVPEQDIASWQVGHVRDIEKLVDEVKALCLSEQSATQPEDEPCEPELKQSGITLEEEENEEDTSIDFENSSMYDLFRLEVETHTAVLNEGLLEFENNPSRIDLIEPLMRAAHSIKGAARFVGVETGVSIAHVIEDCLVSAKEGEIDLTSDKIDILLKGVDLLALFSKIPETAIADWQVEHEDEVKGLEADIKSILVIDVEKVVKAELPELVQVEDKPVHEDRRSEKQFERLEDNDSLRDDKEDKFIKMSVENLNRLMGLAGESMIETGWLQPFSESLKKLKHMQVEVNDLLENLQTSIENKGFNEYAKITFTGTLKKVSNCRDFVNDRLVDLETYSMRASNLSNRLYREIISNRMRPFADGVRGFPRMVRDLSKKLGKEVNLEIIGKSTKIDRDILIKLDAPFNHIIRNAIDHGIEMPDERLNAGKQAKAIISIKVRHKAGMLSVAISDDGRGIDYEKLKQKLLNKGMVNAEMAGKLTKEELIAFLFLPGFTTTESVTEISGRGVGLDVVKSMVEEVDGTLCAESVQGEGMTISMLLPLTRSVIRTLLVEIAGEPYAFPVAGIDRAIKINKPEVKLLEDKQYFAFENRNVGLISACQIFELDREVAVSDELSIIVISDKFNQYGIVVDSFIGEFSLVVKTLDARLGKIPNISSAAILEDGSPVLIVYVEDMVRSINKILSSDQLIKVGQDVKDKIKKAVKRVLVVDDSITVREVVRKLLENKGYKVEIAVDGRDGWNAVRALDYNLVISDVDMPRMNGFEFVKLIKADSRLKNIPVMIVSYKDSEDDKMKGLTAGANYYLTKGSFHDESLLNAVVDLIGNA